MINLSIWIRSTFIVNKQKCWLNKIIVCLEKSWNYSIGFRWFFVCLVPLKKLFTQIILSYNLPKKGCKIRPRRLALMIIEQWGFFNTQTYSNTGYHILMKSSPKTCDIQTCCKVFDHRICFNKFCTLRFRFKHQTISMQDFTMCIAYCIT